MAKKSDNDPKQNTLARIRRTEAYAERVRTLFAATVNEILALNKTMPTLPEGEMFSFDNESLKKQKEVERLLRQLHSVATMAIEKGIRLEWAQANAECDKLVQSCFGKRALETPEFTAWAQRNEAAMAAFISRSERGLNLSQRVWKSCRQLRDEMEVAITVAVGDGTSAASMSRSVRKYLNDPDLMFRRFRYKIGEEIEYDEDGNEIGKKIVWGKKWKKKIRKPDGTVGWIDYDKDSYQDEWTGPGYYKSSAQNAMRVARTETNIAYRRADNARWQQMDFVLGQRVQLSHNHPKKDICDKLAGDYPHDFVFDGWHPQCFCFVTPILMDEDEILKMNEAMLKGEKYTPKGRRITQYPENFKQWVSDNKDKILASHDNGTDPYFVRNNFAAVQDIMNPKKQLTPLEIAEQRHANRTPEQEEKIRLAWQERKDRIEAEKRAAEAERLRIERINNAAQNVLKVAQTRFADFDIDTVALDAAVQSGDTTLINAETRALAKKLSEKQKQVKQTANNVIGVASKFKDFSGDADMTSLQDLMKTGNVSAINAQTRAIAQRVLQVKQDLRKLSHIPDAVEQAKTFTVAELQSVNSAVEKTFARWTWNLTDDASLSFLRGKLEQEIVIVESRKDKYSTWEIARDAYKKRLDLINKRIEMKRIETDLQTDFVFASTSRAKDVKMLASEIGVMLRDNDCDMVMLKAKATSLKTRVADLRAKAAARAARKSKSSASVGGTFDTSNYGGYNVIDELNSLSDSEFENILRNGYRGELGEFITLDKNHYWAFKAGRMSRADFMLEVKKAIDAYDGDITKPMPIAVAVVSSLKQKVTASQVRQIKSHGGGGYVGTSNSFKMNGCLRNSTKIDPYSGDKWTSDDDKTMADLDKAISDNKLHWGVTLYRAVDTDWLKGMTGMTVSWRSTDILAASQTLVGKPITSSQYTSASANPALNVFGSRPIMLFLRCKKNTSAYMTTNYAESELILGRGQKMVVSSVTLNPATKKVEIVVEVG